MIAVLATNGCNRPISDPDELRAIRVEAMRLMETHPPQSSPGYTSVAKQDWPAAISLLHPEAVTVHPWGVDITTKPHFDGGWGYEVPQKKADLPMPASCYSEPSRGVFWHGPC
jgi:hypothetical protein